MGVFYMFIGRERELASLNKLYNSDKFEFVVLYGRRRVGKTALINRFIEGKSAIYYMGVESNAKQNLENLSKCIIEYASGIDAESSFASFQIALETVFRLAEKERIILAIDEYPYVARASKSLASTLQMLIDRYKDRSKLMLILCGSSMSYMEDHVLSYKAPLYGRRTSQIKLLPFDFEESCQYLQNYSAEDKALAYGIMGGTPSYLLQINDRLSIEENIKNTYLNPTSPLRGAAQSDEAGGPGAGDLYGDHHRHRYRLLAHVGDLRQGRRGHERLLHISQKPRRAGHRTKRDALRREGVQKVDLFHRR